MTDTMMEPRQPIRLEKKANMMHLSQITGQSVENVFSPLDVSVIEAIFAAG
jgi:hypothetical protein